MSEQQSRVGGFAVERPCFTPITTKVCVAAAKAVGIDPGKAVDVNFEFGPPGHAFVVARYPLDDAAMARVLEALAAIPSGANGSRSQLALLSEGAAVVPSSSSLAGCSVPSGKSLAPAPGHPRAVPESF